MTQRQDLERLLAAGTPLPWVPEPDRIRSTAPAYDDVIVLLVDQSDYRVGISASDFDTDHCNLALAASAVNALPGHLALLTLAEDACEAIEDLFTIWPGWIPPAREKAKAFLDALRDAGLGAKP